MRLEQKMETEASRSTDSQDMRSPSVRPLSFPGSLVCCASGMNSVVYRAPAKYLLTAKFQQSYCVHVKLQN
jgi:hypothetical protein